MIRILLTKNNEWKRPRRIMKGCMIYIVYLLGMSHPDSKNAIHCMRCINSPNVQSVYNSPLYTFECRRNKIKKN